MHVDDNMLQQRSWQAISCECKSLKAMFFLSIQSRIKGVSYQSRIIPHQLETNWLFENRAHVSSADSVFLVLFSQSLFESSDWVTEPYPSVNKRQLLSTATHAVSSQMNFTSVNILSHKWRWDNNDDVKSTDDEGHNQWQDKQETVDCKISCNIFGIFD